MANSYINPRGAHVAAGIYSNEIEVSYAVRSLGVTSLGVAGETVKGPAFEPIEISNWREFQDVFGGTNPEKFRGSDYPKYELPYIAKEYLTESENLHVVRVLGLSGYNAGPAWVITASDGTQGGTKYAIAVLRARGGYVSFYENTSLGCACKLAQYDYLKYDMGDQGINNAGCYRKPSVSNLKLVPYTPILGTGDPCNAYGITGGTAGTTIPTSKTNRGIFKISGTTSDNTSFEYVCSLNPNDKEYILNVLGTAQDDGDKPVFVESLYDLALEKLIGGTGIASQVNQIDTALTFYADYYTADYCWHKPVDGLLYLTNEELRRSNVGMRFLAEKDDTSIKVCVYDYDKGLPSAGQISSGNPYGSDTVKKNTIYTVRQYTTQEGQRKYLYTTYAASSYTGSTDWGNISGTPAGVNIVGKLDTSNTLKGSSMVYNEANGYYYKYTTGGPIEVTCDLNDYKSAYRYASTPWIVSNLKGDYNKAEVNKLFRFHTISDGNSANFLVKVSVENIRPDNGTFDVVVRNIYDVDEAIQPLEKFVNCTLVPGDERYIAYQIGSFDGSYESKSRYITVETIESTTTMTSAPAGFMGYHYPKYDGEPIDGEKKTDVKYPSVYYNLNYDPEIKNKRQYFGLSSIVGVDIDLFTFKGTKSYIDDPSCIGHGFHLDSRLNNSQYQTDANLVVDGEPGYKFDAVSLEARTSLLPNAPIIDTEENMEGSIYEYVNLRKFTVYFEGGFDGWDIYRAQRTIGDNFKAGLYKGYLNDESGEGYAFDRIKNPASLSLNQNGITSDWYAYLSAFRQFANTNATDINVLALPNVDPINATLLTEEAIDMIEEERGDTLYIMNLPDKPNGAGDYIDSMYSAERIVEVFDDTEVHSNYAATYYPWVKILDSDNGQYIYVSPTKDVVRNLAYVDNQNPNGGFVAAGYSKGVVNCVRAKKNLVLAEEDVLAGAGINEIKTFGKDGCRIWGQRTIAADQDSQLSRINVRRVLLKVKKLVNQSCVGLIFEPNDETARQSFISAVSPILDNFRSAGAITDYRIEVDNTSANLSRYEMRAHIYIKVKSLLEFISISYILTPEGVSFDDIM